VPHPLEGIRAKLDRGDKHVRAFNDELDRVNDWEQPPAVTVHQEADFDRQLWVLTIAEVDPLPQTLGVLVGDAIHNFRSALDQLVFELAFMDTRGTEMDKTAFPCSPTLDNFRSAHVQKLLLAGLTQRHRTLIKRMQPYRRWNWPKSAPPYTHPFALMSDISNDDKHRLVQPTLLAPVEMNFEVPPRGRDCHVRTGALEGDVVLGLPLEVNTEVLRVPIAITGPDPNMEVQSEIKGQIGFRNGAACERLLEEIARHAREAVELVAPEFERPVGQRLAALPRYGRLTPPIPGPPTAIRLTRKDPS
jgi:hypothetical protein